MEERKERKKKNEGQRQTKDEKVDCDEGWDLRERRVARDTTLEIQNRVMRSTK